MANYKDIVELANETAMSLTRSSQNWMTYLSTVSRLYKYPFHEQLMIYAQRPEATACAEFDVWNKRMGRYIKRGSKGILLASAQGARYVFDVADTGARDRSRPFKLWEYSDEYRTAISEAFKDKYNIDHTDLFNIINSTARRLAREYWRDNSRDIIYAVANSFMEEYDRVNIRVTFLDAATTSATYSALLRCGEDPAKYYDYEDFHSIFDFNSLEIISELGAAVSGINEQILRQIEITIKHYEREKHAERMKNNERTDLQTDGRLPDTRFDVPRNEGNLRQVRNDEGGLSEEPPQGAMEQTDIAEQADTTPQRDRQDSEREDRADDAAADGNGRSDGGTQGERPIEMGGLDEQLHGTGGGNHNAGANLQLSLFPTEDEQIKSIDEAEGNNNLPFAFSVSDTDLEHLLRTGSNSDSARMAIASEFSKNKGLESNAEFLKSMYKGGYGIQGEKDDFAAWYAEDGVHIGKGTSVRYSRNAQIYSWNEIAEKIGAMLDKGTFATNVELAEMSGYERKEIAESTLFLFHDLSDEANEKGYLSILRRESFGGFPDESHDLEEKLKDSEFQKQLISELDTLIADSEENSTLIRFKFHKPQDLRKRIAELAIERTQYTTSMAEIPETAPFITDDEINALLMNGSGFDGGKTRIYEYFTAEHDLECVHINVCKSALCEHALVYPYIIFRNALPHF